MREPLDIDDLDELDIRARTPDEHRTAAEILLGWGTERHPDDGEGVTPAELLARAGEQLSAAGDHQGAIELFRRALDAEGDTELDVRGELHSELLAIGDIEGARRLAEEIRRSKPADPMVYVWIAEGYEEFGDLTEANRWMNLGLRLVMAEADADELSAGAVTLLLGRRRIREALGFPPDEYDEHPDLPPPVELPE